MDASATGQLHAFICIRIGVRLRSRRRESPRRQIVPLRAQDLVAGTLLETGDRKGRLGQTVAGMENFRGESMGREQLGELPQHAGLDGFGAHQ